MNTNNTYSIPFRWGANVWTGFVLLWIVLPIVIALRLVTFWRGDADAIPRNLLMLVTCFIVPTLALYAIITLHDLPRRLEVSDGKITIWTLYHHTTWHHHVDIPLSGIVDMEHFTKDDIKDTTFIRRQNFSIAYTGKHHNARLGDITMYATQMKQPVYVRTHDKVYVFNRPDAQEFIDLVSPRAEQCKDTN